VVKETFTCRASDPLHLIWVLGSLETSHGEGYHITYYRLCQRAPVDCFLLMEHLICQPIQAASMYHCRTYIDYMYEEGDNLSNGLSFRSLNK
jgi:hypothetical protein